MDGDFMKWFRFYHDALDDPKVQRLPDKLFKFWINMLCIASRADERGVIDKSVSDIAFALRLDDADAETMLDELVQRGLIDVVEGVLCIHNWDVRQFKSDDVAKRVAKHRNVTRNVTDNVSGNVPSSVSVSDSASSSDSGKKSTILDRFETFWKAYPRKVAKGDARKWWVKHNPDDQLLARILAALDLQCRTKSWTDDGGKFIPYPATWLNREGWEDEVQGVAAIRLLKDPEQMTEQERWQAEYDLLNSGGGTLYGQDRLRRLSELHKKLQASA